MHRRRHRLSFLFIFSAFLITTDSAPQALDRQQPAGGSDGRGAHGPAPQLGQLRWPGDDHASGSGSEDSSLSDWDEDRSRDGGAQGRGGAASRTDARPGSIASTYWRPERADRKNLLSVVDERCGAALSAPLASRLPTGQDSTPRQ